MIYEGDYVSPMLFKNLETMLQKKKLSYNYYRKNSGVGRSQCFGMVKQRTCYYAGSGWNFTRPDLLDELQKIAKLILPSNFSYTSIQVNDNYQTAPHKDTGNVGVSAIVGFGSYTGGNLLVEGKSYCIKNHLLFFDGSKLEHSTEPWMGDRYSLVFFTVARKFFEIPRYRAIEYGDSLYCLESLDDIDRILDRSGRCVWSSDNYYPIQKQRSPSCRYAIEHNSRSRAGRKEKN